MLAFAGGEHMESTIRTNQYNQRNKPRPTRTNHLLTWNSQFYQNAIYQGEQMDFARLDRKARVDLILLDRELEDLYAQYDSAEWYSRETLTPDTDCQPIADRIFAISLKQSEIMERAQ